MLLISMTFDTYHSPIGPLEQPPFGGASLRHALTALLSSALDRGKKAMVVCVRACVTVRGGGDRAVGLSSKQVERTGDSRRVKV